ncbi:MAG: hypothetical protein U0R72_14365 [Nakamurella multipartita]
MRGAEPDGGHHPGDEHRGGAGQTGLRIGGVQHRQERDEAEQFLTEELDEGPDIEEGQVASRREAVGRLVRDEMTGVQAIDDRRHQAGERQIDQPERQMVRQVPAVQGPEDAAPPLPG